MDGRYRSHHSHRSRHRHHHGDDERGSRYGERDYDRRHRYHDDQGLEHHRHHHGDHDDNSQLCYRREYDYYDDHHYNDHRFQDRPPRETPPYQHHHGLRSHSSHDCRKDGHKHGHDDVEDSGGRHDLISNQNVRAYQGKVDGRYGSTAGDHRSYHPVKQTNTAHSSEDTTRGPQNQESQTAGVRERIHQPYRVSTLAVAEELSSRSYTGDAHKEDSVMIDDRRPQPYSIADLPTFQRAPSHDSQQWQLQENNGRKSEPFAFDRIPAQAAWEDATEHPNLNSSYNRSVRPHTHEWNTGQAENVERAGRSRKPGVTGNSNLKSALKQNAQTDVDIEKGAAIDETPMFRGAEANCEKHSGDCSHATSNKEQEQSTQRPVSETKMSSSGKGPGCKSVSFDLPSTSSSSSNGSEAAGIEERNQPNSRYSPQRIPLVSRRLPSFNSRNAQETQSLDHRMPNEFQRSEMHVDTAAAIRPGQHPVTINNTNTNGGVTNIRIYCGTAPNDFSVSETMRPEKKTRDIGTMTSQHNLKPFFPVS